MKGSVEVFLCLLGLSVAYEDKSIVTWLKDNDYHTVVYALNVTGLMPDLNNTGKILFKLYPLPNNS